MQSCKLVLSLMSRTPLVTHLCMFSLYIADHSMLMFCCCCCFFYSKAHIIDIDIITQILNISALDIIILSERQASVTKEWRQRERTSGTCHGMFSVEYRYSTELDAGEMEGGAELENVPGDQSVCTADQSVACSAPWWLMSWQWTLEVWVIAFQFVIHGERPVHWHPLALWLSSQSCAIPPKYIWLPNR